MFKRNLWDGVDTEKTEALLITLGFLKLLQ